MDKKTDIKKPLTKTCNICSIEKDITNFYSTYRKKKNITEYKAQCKECFAKTRIRNVEYDKSYYKNNRDNCLEYSKNYRELNRNIINAKKREYSKTNREKLNKKLQEKRKNPIIKLRHQVSCAIRMTMARNKSNKNGKSICKYLSYSFSELKQHLESQFEPWMNWDNWGLYNHNNWNDNDPTTWTWNIDHIIPQSDLPYTSMEDDNFKKCWMLDNLRPLSSKVNLIEGALRNRHK